MRCSLLAAKQGQDPTYHKILTMPLPCSPPSLPHFLPPSGELALTSVRQPKLSLLLICAGRVMLNFCDTIRMVQGSCTILGSFVDCSLSVIALILLSDTVVSSQSDQAFQIPELLLDEWGLLPIFGNKHYSSILSNLFSLFLVCP